MQQEYYFDSNLSLTEYDSFAKNHPYCNILQSSPWASVKAEWLPIRAGLRDKEGHLLAACQILVRPLLFSYAFWYIPHGPLLDYHNVAVLERFLSELAAFAKKNKAIFLRIHPPVVIREGSIQDFRENKEKELFPPETLHKSFNKAGYLFKENSLAMEDTIQPRFQALIRKELWEEPPRGKIRYNLKQADRYAISIKDLGQNGLEAFSELIKRTEERQGIKLRNKAYFQRILEAYGSDALLSLSHFNLGHSKRVAEKNKAALEEEIEQIKERAPRKARQLEEQVVSREKDLSFYAELESSLPEDEPFKEYPSGILAIRYGQAAEMPYAASDERYARLPAVWSLYHHGISWAFSAGCTKYNLGGLEGTFDDGLATFKSHFNPIVEETAGEYDYPARPLLYRLLMKALQLWKKWRA